MCEVLFGGGSNSRELTDVSYNAPRCPGAFSFTEEAAGSAIQAHLIKIKLLHCAS